MQITAVALTALAVLFMGIATWAHPLYEPIEVGDHSCDNTKKYNCSDTATCCLIGPNEFGCCRMKDAVCCSDKVHCCPKGTTCNLEHKNCPPAPPNVGYASVVSAMTEIDRVSEPDKVTCTDKTTCPDKYTCCKLGKNDNDGFGCCPIPNAVCCDDGVHCCPFAYKCNKDRTCTDIFLNVVLQRKMLVKSPPSVVVPEKVTCADKTACPDKYTCCKIGKKENDGYGCCPQPNAVCCSDGLHCCPYLYKCNDDGTCTDIFLNIVMQRKVQPKSPQNVVCPNGTSECQDGQTCCKLPDGNFGCCPFPYAACCTDGVHCCPNGYTCDLSNGKCFKEGEKIALFEKLPAMVSSKTIICPNSNTRCQSGQTCCKLVSGKQGCCPLPEAVCCSDGIHCCPNEYTCSSGGCTKQGETIPLFKKLPAIKSPENVICADGQHECQTGQTCCKLSSGQYGCCPLPNAVCCTDGVHCCPGGYTCDLSSGKCSKEGEKIALLEKLPAMVSSETIICPKSNTRCQSGQTCCKLATGEEGCCPLSQAVCCSDGIHCCPHGYTCSSGSCSKQGETIPLFKKLPAIELPENVICADGQHECQTGQTCCKLSSGQYGCCPLPNAVCCTDGVYCCPGGYTCDLSDGKCSKQGKKIALFKKLPAIESPKSLKQLSALELPNIVCPGGQHQCQEGQNGCCPVPNAVCCPDDVHCCPEGYTCSTSGGTCIKPGKTIASFEKVSAKKLPTNKICPDGVSGCPDDQTCCEVKSGKYGCCPLPNAVCCTDDVHCCPEGYTCNSNGGTCTKQGQSISLIKTLVATPTVGLSDDPINVICPDKTKCPIANTCCELAKAGTYGCCPQNNGVCCSDHKNCCPEGYTCDLDENMCKPKSSAVHLLTSLSQQQVSSPSETCPDGVHLCDTKQTCCPLTDRAYGCCSVPDAVCCDDGVHCCPKDHICDLKDSKCMKNISAMQLLTRLPRLKKLPAIESPKSVVCLDGESVCKDGQTCCKLLSGQWGCCPQPQAVCCSDGVHCCPNGYTCDVSGGTCSKQGETIAFFEKLPAIKSPKSVVCPDGESECKDGQTCCKLSSGQYGCCPVANAVCCSDGVHCCLKGYTCDVSGGTCSKQGKTIAFFEKLPAIKSPKSVVCPDGQSECKDDQTCCKLPSGQYGCCPIPKAVCCSDGVHCCPAGYTCDISAGTCSKKGEKIAIFKKLPTNKSPVVVKCPDGVHQCQDGETCCKLASGQYGCCPSPNAVCCTDGKHCCPQGYTCNAENGNCVKQGEGVAFLQKIKAHKPSIRNRVHMKYDRNLL